MRWLLLLLCGSVLGNTASMSGDVTKAIQYASYIHTAYHKDLNGLIQLELGRAVSNFATSEIKQEVGKDRPDGGENSFPSGHTSRAFAPAWHIYHRYGWKQGAPYLAAATYVGWTRVKLDKHYPEDVIGSAALTYFVSHYTSGTDAPKIGIYYGNGVHVSFDYRW